MNNLVEKVTCKKCSNVKYFEIETLNKESIKVSNTSLDAIVIKKYNCEKCNSSNLIREITNNDISKVI